MVDPAVQRFLDGLARAVQDVQAHPMLSDGVRRHLRLRREDEVRALTFDALTVGTDLALNDLDSPLSSVADLVSQAARVRHCRLDTDASPLPVIVNRSTARRTVSRVAECISLRADEATVALLRRRGLPHYVRQAELAAIRAVQTLGGTAPGPPITAIAALDDAMDYALVALAADRALHLTTARSLGHS